MTSRQAVRIFLPFLDWIGEWRHRAVVRADLIAGITVALVLIPQSMAYARLAGLPAYYGLYAALLPPAVAALFGSSRQLATGPVAMASLISATAVQQMAAGDAARMVGLSIELALLVGIMRLVLGVCRLGMLVNFLARPVIIGFTNAGVLIIATSQLEKLLGITNGATGRVHVETLWHVVREVPVQAHWPTLCMAALAILVQVLVRRLWPRGPAVLFAVIMTALVARITHFSGDLVGAIPRGLPAVQWPPLSTNILAALLPAALIITLIGMMEAMAIAKTIATQTRQRIDVNQELIGQGLANLAGSFTHSFVVSGSFSRSALNFAAGARTGMAAVVTSLAVAAMLLWGTPLLFHVPQATLAAIIVVAVLPLFSLQVVREAWRAQWQDGLIAGVTFIVTLVTAPQLQIGILTGVGLALVLFLYRTMYPHVALLARHPDGTLRDLRVHHLQACRHIAVVRFDGQLYFGNCSFFEDKVLEAIAGNAEMRTVILDAAGINRIDASGEFTLRAVAQHLREAGIAFLIARGKHAFLHTLERAGFTALLGRDRFFHRTEDAIEHAWRDMNCDHVSQCPLYQPLPIVPATAPPG